MPRPQWLRSRRDNPPPARPQPPDDSYFQLTTEQIAELTAYVIRREKSLDRHLRPYCDPAGKDVLVFGCGFGNEVLWAARHKARSVLAVDQSAALSPVPFRRALRELGMHYDPYEFRRQSIHETALAGERYDLIVSNSVFEHVTDLKGVLEAFRELLRPGGGDRHLLGVALVLVDRWPHRQGAVGASDASARRARAGALGASLGRALQSAEPHDRHRLPAGGAQRRHDRPAAATQTDPNLDRLADRLPRIRELGWVSPTDLSIESIGCELCFEENL